MFRSIPSNRCCARQHKAAKGLSPSSVRPSFVRRLQLETLESRELFSISAEDQLLLELVNRARADPVAEIERNLQLDRRDSDLSASDLVTTLNQGLSEEEYISPEPKQPLAPHPALARAMENHLDDMLARDYFGHDSPEGGTPSSRARSEGYPQNAGENIAWSGRTDRIEPVEEIYKRHRGLVRSEGHRINMMRDRWREVGPGVEYGMFRQNSQNFNSIMVGTLFGNRGGDLFITGVAITDTVVRNNFYEIGEGLSGVKIEAQRIGTDETFTAVTGRAGGYSLRVPKGTYTLKTTSSNIRPIIVRNVVVDDQNVKVDFNNAGMPTRFIAGNLYEDVNGNRQRDSSDPNLTNQVVYIDLNDNGEHEASELTAITDETGRFQFSSLLPGEYTIRQVLQRDWIQTQPFFGTYVVPLTTRNIEGVDFGSLLLNESPVANEDSATVVSGRSVEIPVLSNDIDSDGTINPNSLRVSRIPRNGIAEVSANNQLIYTPNAGFSGVETFSYTVDDNRGARSESGVVTVTVERALPFHNADNPFDVNGDGFVVSRDVLVIINELNRSGARSLAGFSRGPSIPYYDVNGDEFLSPLDALRVIQNINRRGAGGEPPSEEAAVAEEVAAAEEVSRAEETRVALRESSARDRDAFFALLARDDDDTVELNS